MNPYITIAKKDLKKHPEAEGELSRFSRMVKEVSRVNVYVSENSVQLMEFICYLKDSNIPFSFFPDEKELIASFP